MARLSGRNSTGACGRLSCWARRWTHDRLFCWLTESDERVEEESNVLEERNLSASQKIKRR